MNSTIFTIILLLYATFCNAQKVNDKFEVTPFIKWDSYPSIKYSINPVNSNTTRISGTSFGINVSYKLKIHKSWKFVTGIGYYKYSFNKIKEVNSLFANYPYNTRIIEDYIPPGQYTPGITFSTDKYWYNSFSINIGLEKQVLLKKEYEITTAVQLSNYFTFSQTYHVRYPNPKGDKYKKNNFKYFGFSAEITTSIQKKLGNFSIGPKLIFPIYNLWKQDSVFPQEMDNKSRNKFFNGFGAGISCNLPINYKKTH